METQSEDDLFNDQYDLDRVQYDEYDEGYIEWVGVDFAAGYLAILTAIGIITNSFIIQAILRKRHLKTSMNFFLLHVAIFDIFGSLIFYYLQTFYSTLPTPKISFDWNIFVQL